MGSRKWCPRPTTPAIGGTRDTPGLERGLGTTSLSNRDRPQHVQVVISRQRVLAAAEQSARVKDLRIARLDEDDVAVLDVELLLQCGLFFVGKKFSNGRLPGIFFDFYPGQSAGLVDRHIFGKVVDFFAGKINKMKSAENSKDFLEAKKHLEAAKKVGIENSFQWHYKDGIDVLRLMLKSSEVQM